MASRLHTIVLRALLLTLPLTLLVTALPARSQVLSLLSLASNVIKVSKDTPKTLDVTAEGTGETREKALSNATINAVKQALGTMIISSQTAVNDELVSSDIVERTAGVVNHYDVNHCDVDATKGGLYVCEIKATVSSELVIKGLESNGAKVVLVDGEQVYGQQVTYRTRIQSERDIVMAIIRDYPKRGIDVTIKKVTPIPTDKDVVVLEVQIQVAMNPGWLQELEGVLTTINADVGSTSRGSLSIRKKGERSGTSYHVYDPVTAQLAESFLESMGVTDQNVGPQGLGKWSLSTLSPHTTRELDLLMSGKPLLEFRLLGNETGILGSTCFIFPYAPFAGGITDFEMVRRYRLAVPEKLLSRVVSVEVVSGCTHEPTLLGRLFSE